MANLGLPLNLQFKDTPKDILLYSGLGLLAGIGAIKLFDSLKPSITHTEPTTVRARSGSETEDSKKIIQEQLIRNIQFFGAEGQDKIGDSFIIVAGVGGLGSHVVSAIVRSGIRKIRIIDPDNVHLSTLSKHAFATHEDIGKSKIECCVKFIAKIFPHLEVSTVQGELNKRNVNKLLEGNPTYIIDCMDNAEAKAVLIDHCFEHKLRVISSGDTSMKSDPTRIQIRDIRDVSYDGLIRSVRMSLRAKGNKKGSVKVVYSVEKSIVNHSISSKIKNNWATSSAAMTPKFGVMTALVGYSLASYVLCDIAGQIYEPRVMDDVRCNNYERIYKDLLFCEKKAGVKPEDIEVDIEDVFILVREVFEWTSVVSGKRLHDLELVRWDPNKKTSIRNLVLMTEKEARAHREFTDIKGKYDKDVEFKVTDMVNKREEILSQRGASYKF